MTAIADQVASLESKLAAYESRKVPLSTTRLKEEYHAKSESHVGGLLAVARAALVAAEAPDALGAAERAFVKSEADGSMWFAVRAAIRAAHDAAIDGGCQEARKTDDPPWIADAVKALGLTDPDGTPFLLSWTQVTREIRELRDRLNAESKHHKLTMEDRDKWMEEAKRLEKERDGLRRETDVAEQVNWRPVVHVGQVWQYGPTGKHVTVEHVGTTKAVISPGGEITLLSDGRPYSPHWLLVSGAPFELPAPSDLSSRNEIALRDKLREIERRLVNLERAK